MRKYERDIEVEGIHYRFTAVNGGPVHFYVTGGGSNTVSFKRHFWNDDLDSLSVSDFNFRIAAMKVFIRMKPLLLDWVYTEKPYAFHFKASTPRKHKIYKWIVARLAKQLGHCYDVSESGKTFYFNRKKTEECR